MELGDKIQMIANSSKGCVWTTCCQKTRRNCQVVSSNRAQSLVTVHRSRHPLIRHERELTSEAPYLPCLGGESRKFPTCKKNCRGASRKSNRSRCTFTHCCDAFSTISGNLFLILCLFLLPSICSARAIFGETRATADDIRSSSEIASAPSRSQSVDVLDYMTSFGYLPQSDVETEALRTREEVERVLRKLQSFAHIPITGRLDEATLDLMATPRCGLPDFSSEDDDRDRRSRRYVLGPSKWEKSDVTYRILNYTPDLHQAEVEDSIRRAFRTWAEVTNLNFYQVFSGHADILVSFGRGYHTDGYPFDGPGVILAHAFSPGEDLGGDVHFDDDEMWTYNVYDGTNLFLVAAHEVGHALGLSHSSVMESLMYPWYKGFDPNFQLHTDDIAGIQVLYGYKYPPRPVPTAPPLPTTTTTTIAPSTTTTTFQGDGSGCPTADPNAPPDSCFTSIDAISMIRGELFIFKGKWLWRLNENGMMANYPAPTSQMFPGLPESEPRVDAAYEKQDGTHVLFAGNKRWTFHGSTLMRSHSLTYLGLPEDVTHVDAAFVWPYNRKTYLIVGSMYWRFNEDTDRVEESYPRDMNMWGGVELPVGDVFNHRDGATYFFSGTKYWRFNDNRMHVSRNGYPRDIGQDWLGCTASGNRAFQTGCVLAGAANRNFPEYLALAVIILAIKLFS